MLIEVFVDATLLPGKFGLTMSREMEPLRSMAMLYGMSLAEGSCSCARVQRLLCAFAEAEGLSGFLRLTVCG